MGSRTLDIGIAGASGAVGSELLRVMAEQRFPVGTLKLFGSTQSAGDVREYAGEHHVVRPLTAEAAEGLDVLVFATPEETSRAWVGPVLDRGVVVVDASAAYRDDADVPLVVPPVNGRDLADHTGVVASPGSLACATALTLGPLVATHAVDSVDAVAMVSASERGRAGMTELSNQVLGVLKQQPFDTTCFGRQIAFSVFPWVDHGGATAGLEGVVEKTPAPPGSASRRAASRGSRRPATYP